MMPRTADRRGSGGWLLLLLAAVAVASWIPASHAETRLGGERAGTASGTFLKIPVSARAAAFGGAHASLVQGPEAVFINPAGLAFQSSPALFIGYVDWASDLEITALAHSRYLASAGIYVGIYAAGMSTTLDETDEFHPLGTGRRFSFSDFVGGLALSKNLTDRLTLGVGIKYFREGLGTEIGGPSINAVLFDAGSVYRVGFREARIGMSMTSFGGDLEPDGSFASHVEGTDVAYSSFSAPTMFRLSFGVDAWRTGSQTLWTIAEIQNIADNEETAMAGVEWTQGDFFSLRGGYNLNSDVFGLNFGAGLRTTIAGRAFLVDYAFSDGDYLEDVHRWNLTLVF
jgi:hypothetical protein